MQPYFFHTTAAPLFGVYTPPGTARPCDEAVLLCPPVGHEYHRAHWALRQAAERLARAGRHVLRFDYAGVGDSGGDFPTMTLGRWSADVRVALKELAESAGTARVSLVGLRLGAALAFAAVADLPVRRLVLWDPVVRGADYLDGLRRLQDERRRLWRYAAPNRPGAGDEELLGYRYGATLVRELAEVDLLGGPLPRAGAVHVLASADRPEYRQLYERFVAAGRAAALHVSDDAGDWDAVELFSEAVLPGPLQRTLAEIFAE